MGGVEVSPEKKNVVVGEVKPVTVTKSRAWRLVIGRFVVDFIESFAALAFTVIGINFVLPLNIEGWQLLAVQLAAPATSALISAGRRSWPAIRAWLLGEEAK